MEIANELGKVDEGHVQGLNKKSLKKEIIDWVKFSIILAIAYIIISNTAGLTLVSGFSMEPTLRDKSLLFVNKLSVHISEPEYGDVVVVQQKGYDIIKRVVGISGDTVKIEKGIVYVNGTPLPEVYTLGKANDMKEITVGEDKVFIMGDNRTPGESLDSRDPSIGPVSVKKIKGYAEVSLFPMYRIMKPLQLK